MERIKQEKEEENRRKLQAKMEKIAQHKRKLEERLAAAAKKNKKGFFTAELSNAAFERQLANKNPPNSQRNQARDV